MTIVIDNKNSEFHPRVFEVYHIEKAYDLIRLSSGFLKLLAPDGTTAPQQNWSGKMPRQRQEIE